jgi:hypothetical protein
MYLFGSPVHFHTRLKSVVIMGVMVTTENEVGAVLWTMIFPVGPMVELATMPVAEMVMLLIHDADQDSCC